MTRRQGIKRSILSFLTSLLAIVLIMLLTSPIDNITYALPFFAAFFALAASLGYLLAYIRSGRVTSKSRSRIFIISTFLMLVLMFKSAQSFSWIDAAVLLLVVAGLLFYSSRRAA